MPEAALKVEEYTGQKACHYFADTQGEAEKIAKDLAASSGGGEVRIHGLDGKIRDKRHGFSSK